MVHVYSTNDWTCIYVDGEKEVEGHSRDFTFREGVQFGMMFGHKGFIFFIQINEDDKSFPEHEWEIDRENWDETYC